MRVFWNDGKALHHLLVVEGTKDSIFLSEQFNALDLWLLAKAPGTHPALFVIGILKQLGKTSSWWGLWTNMCMCWLIHLSIPSFVHACIHSFTHSYIYQSINQSINQSITHSLAQSINQSITHSLNQSINQSINQSLTRSINQSINQSNVHPIISKQLRVHQFRDLFHHPFPNWRAIYQWLNWMVLIMA